MPSWRTILTTIASVLRRPRYAMLAIAVTAVVLVVAIWLPNLSYIGDTIVSDIAWRYKATILVASLGALQTNFTAATRATTIVVALLAGINAALLAHVMFERRRIDRLGGVSVLGTLLGLVSVGCAACGSVILVSVFGFSATAAVIGALPLRGVEFAVAGIVALLVSNWFVARRIAVPAACQLPPSQSVGHQRDV